MLYPKKEAMLILDKMSNKENYLSIDKVYLKDYLKNLDLIHMGKSSISSSINIPSLITQAVKDSGINPNTKLNNALLYLELPNSTEFEKIIEFSIDAENILQCPFNYAVATSRSQETNLYFITKTNNNKSSLLLKDENISKLRKCMLGVYKHPNNKNIKVWKNGLSLYLKMLLWDVAYQHYSDGKRMIIKSVHHHSDEVLKHLNQDGQLNAFTIQEYIKNESINWMLLLNGKKVATTE